MMVFRLIWTVISRLIWTLISRLMGLGDWDTVYYQSLGKPDNQGSHFDLTVICSNRNALIWTLIFRFIWVLVSRLIWTPISGLIRSTGFGLD